MRYTEKVSIWPVGFVGLNINFKLNYTTINNFN